MVLYGDGVVIIHGMLGNDTTSGNTDSPIQIGSLTNWKAVNGGWLGFCAIKTDGTIWAWGYNSQGSVTLMVLPHNFSSPVQIGALNRLV